MDNHIERLERHLLATLNSRTLIRGDKLNASRWGIEGLDKHFDSLDVLYTKEIDRIEACIDAYTNYLQESIQRY